MSHKIVVPPTDAKSEAYQKIRSEWLAICDQETPWETRLSTLIALIKTYNSQVSWVGAYLDSQNDGVLWVNSYQGPLACTKIPPGRGVCGKSFIQKTTLIVPNVHEFPDHIACDSKSLSEIVLPLKKSGVVVGVLDLDSHSLRAFDEIDASHLEEMLLQL